MKGTTDWTYNEIMLLTQIFNIEDFIFEEMGVSNTWNIT